MSSKILVVDDSETVRQQVRQALESAGYEVIEAADGMDGFETIRTAPDLALVLCDINMPRMTGLEMLLALKGQAPEVPILMLTTEGQPSLIRRARDAGAKGWIVKPFKPDLLLAAVAKLIQVNKAA
jgi:two-component system, chemotaxis family, chemotaxis protein CheY